MPTVKELKKEMLAQLKLKDRSVPVAGRVAEISSDAILLDQSRDYRAKQVWIEKNDIEKVLDYS